jgi:hypothetical protein
MIGNPSAAANRRAILQDCRGIAARRLPSLLYETLRQIKNDLAEQAPSERDYRTFTLYKEAMDITQGRWSLIESRFRGHLLDGFDQASRLKASADKPAEASSANYEEMRLMESDDLEQALAGHALARAIEQVAFDELLSLKPRMGALFQDASGPQEVNPLSPEVIGQALITTLKELEGSIKAKLVLIPMLNQYYPRHVQAVYKEVNKHLVDKGVLPALQVAHKHQGAGAAKPQAAEARPAKGAEGKGSDLFGMLQRMVGLGGRNAGRAQESKPAEAEAMHFDLSNIEPPRQFLGELTRLQLNEIDSGAADMGLGNLAVDGRTNVLHSLRGSEATKSLGQVDNMTLDIVALLFDFILDDRRIPDALKALIGRLQIPVLKAALLDKSIFANKSHPARRLLDTLARAAIGWNADEGHNSSLYQKMNTLVLRINKEFTDDLGLFDQLCNDFEEFMRLEKVAAAAATVLTAQQIEARERQAAPLRAAQSEVDGRLEGQPLPKLVRDFLRDHWQRVLAKIHETQGADSEAWVKAISTMDDLIWSVSPKHSSEDRKKLLVTLPKMLKWLEQGLQFLGVDDTERKPFFNELARFHTDAIRPGLDEEEFTNAHDIAVPVLDDSVDVSGDEFEAVAPPPSEAAQPDPALVQAIVDAPEPEIYEEIVIGDVSWLSGQLDQNPAAQVDYAKVVGNMKLGTWIEIDQGGGDYQRAKLAWISPLKGMYMFTDRLGHKAMTINADGLTNKFREGRVRLIDNAPLMDRAVGGLMQKLRQPN